MNYVHEYLRTFFIFTHVLNLLAVRKGILITKKSPHIPEDSCNSRKYCLVLLLVYCASAAAQIFKSGNECEKKKDLLRESERKETIKISERGEGQGRIRRNDGICIFFCH